MRKEMTYPVDKTKINISDTGIKPVDRNSFEGEVFNSANFKIYILKHANIYLYVGKTKQKIGTKLLQGFRSYKNDYANNRQAGYGGYKWIKKYINTNIHLQLFVFDLGSSYSDNHTEAIEAEIVYEIRKASNKWPEFQNEIHFFNEFEDFKGAKDVAKTILDQTRE
jgi:hypothetical protein